MSPAAEGSHDEDNTAPPAKNLLPQKYADPTKSRLTLDIPADGKSDIKIELTD